MKSAKIGFSLLLVMVASFIPGLLVSFGVFKNEFLKYSFSLKHVANFFVYTYIDEDFRVKLKHVFAC